MGIEQSEDASLKQSLISSSLSKDHQYENAFQNEFDRNVKNYAKQSKNLPQNSEQTMNCSMISFSKLDNSNDSLFKNPKLSYKVQYGVAILLLINILMFLVNFGGDGAKVQYKLQFGDNLQTKTFDISNFTLVSSVKYMWQAKVYPLSIIVALFSGVWPSSKIIGMAICWFLPLNKLSFKKREKFLQFLDAVGKWSLIDTYFLLLMLVAFSFDIDLRILGIQMSFRIFVTPLFDFYSFVTATMLSLVLTHIVIHYHRKTHEMNVQQHLDKSSLEVANETKVCLGNGQTQFQKYSVLLIGSTGILLLLGGYIFPMYTFTFEGLAGFMLGDDASYTYSLLSLGILIPYKTDEPYAFGIRYLQVLYFLFTLFIPIAFFTIVLLQQYMNIKLKYAKNLFSITEILYAWSSIDVLALGMIASLLQIRKFAQFMIGNNCAEINQLIVTLKKINPDKYNFEGDSCFDVKTSLNFGTSLLIAVSIILFVFGTYIIRMQQKYLYEKIKQNQTISLNTIINNNDLLNEHNSEKQHAKISKKNINQGKSDIEQQ